MGVAYTSFLCTAIRIVFIQRKNKGYELMMMRVVKLTRVVIDACCTRRVSLINSAVTGQKLTKFLSCAGESLSYLIFCDQRCDIQSVFVVQYKKLVYTNFADLAP